MKLMLVVIAPMVGNERVAKMQRVVAIGEVLMRIFLSEGVEENIISHSPKIKLAVM
jgi:hypothetical protein